MTTRTKRRFKIIIMRICGIIIFMLALIAWAYLYFLMPLSGILDVVLQIATWIIGLIGFSMVVSYPNKKKRR